MPVQDQRSPAPAEADSPCPLVPPAPPFYLAYLAPDVMIYADPLLARPPSFATAPDGSLTLLIGTTPLGRVRAVHRAGAVAVVEVDHLRYEDDPALAAVVLVRAELVPSLPASVAALAARLRAEYGESLTVRQVAAAGVVTVGAVYQALRRGQIRGSREGGHWSFTPEETAVWLVRRGNL